MVRTATVSGMLYEDPVALTAVPSRNQGAALAIATHQTTDAATTIDMVAVSAVASAASNRRVKRGRSTRRPTATATAVQQARLAIHRATQARNAML
jgi:hypothetical protein